MFVSFALLLFALALFHLLAVLADRLERARRAWVAQQWSRRVHEHLWRAVSTTGYAADTGLLTVITEECRRCSAMRLVSWLGTWALNRFGELVNLAPEELALRALL